MSILKLLSRRGIVAAAFALLIGPGLISPAAAQDGRNTQVEEFVRVNANAALQALSDTSLTSAQRQARFSELMDRFTDVRAIALNVIHPAYQQALRNDAALQAEWISVFKEYSFTVYETQLSDYRGREVRVTGSRSLGTRGDVIVSTLITGVRSGRTLGVQWQMQPSGGSWKIRDVAVVPDREPVWLARLQREEFRAALEKNGGNIRDLITRVRTMTANLRKQGPTASRR